MLGAIPVGLRLTPAHAQTGEIVVVNWGGDAVPAYDAIWAQPFNAANPGAKALINGSGPSSGKIKAMVESGAVTWDVCDRTVPASIELGRQNLLEKVDWSIVAQDKVRVVIGDVCSSVTIAMQPVVENAGVLLVNAASSNPDITYKAGVGGFKWSFRNYPTDENRASVVLKYATEQKKIKKFAVLSVDSDYGRGAIVLTKKYLGEFGAEIVSEDYYKDKEAQIYFFARRFSDAAAAVESDEDPGRWIVLIAALSYAQLGRTADLERWRARFQASWPDYSTELNISETGDWAPAASAERDLWSAR